jgi:hypothetical protein
MARFLWLMNTPDKPPEFLDSLAPHQFEIAQQHEMEHIDLADFAGIVLTMHSDQRHLTTQDERLERYVADGGAVIFNGHVVHPFLAALKPFQPIVQKGLESLRIHLETPHPLTAGLTSDDLTFQRSVAGFYSRGGNPPPEAATVLTSIGPNRVAVDWLLKRGAGCLFVHAGNDLFSFLKQAEPEDLTVLHNFFNFFAGASQ